MVGDAMGERDAAPTQKTEREKAWMSLALVCWLQYELRNAQWHKIRCT